MMRLLLVAAFCAELVQAYLQVNYPLGSQFPPIAHVDAPFSFQVAPTTFQSDSDKLQYSLIASPSWLSIDSKSRTLFGTPRASDAGEVSFTIAAAGAAGAVANLNSKLLVSKDAGPKTQGNITQVLSQAGQVSGPHTLTTGPSRPFSISFPTDTFGANGSSLSYVALLSDRTSLPAWISFDTSSLHFAGTTPAASSAVSLCTCILIRLSWGYQLITLALLDHLRHHAHRDQSAWIRRINAVIQHRCEQPSTTVPALQPNNRPG